MKRDALIMALESAGLLGEDEPFERHRRVGVSLPCPECGRRARAKYCSGSANQPHAKRRVFKEGEP